MSLTLHFHPLASFCQKVLIAFYENAVDRVLEDVAVGFSSLVRCAIANKTVDHCQTEGLKLGSQRAGACLRQSCWRG